MLALLKIPKKSRGFTKRELTRRNSDDDELGDAYANGQNWLAQYEAESQKEQEIDGLSAVSISTEEACSLLLVRCFATGSTRELRAVCTQIFFPKCLPSSGNKRKRRKLFWGIHLQIQSK